MRDFDMTRRVKFFIFWLPPVFWAGVIFYFSSIPSLESGLAVSVDWVLRKVAHMGVYAVLAALLFRAFRTGHATELKKAACFAAVFAIGYALTDELHQLYVPGRHGRLRDVGIDALGAALAVIALFRKHRAVHPVQPPQHPGADYV